MGEGIQKRGPSPSKPGARGRRGGPPPTEFSGAGGPQWLEPRGWGPHLPPPGQTIPAAGSRIIRGGEVVKAGGGGKSPEINPPKKSPNLVGKPVGGKGKTPNLGTYLIFLCSSEIMRGPREQRLVSGETKPGAMGDKGIGNKFGSGGGHHAGGPSKFGVGEQDLRVWGKGAGG